MFAVVLTCKRRCAADIQLLNNHTILHARTAFVDWEVSICCASRLYPYMLPCCDGVNQHRSMAQIVIALLSAGAGQAAPPAALVAVTR